MTALRIAQVLSSCHTGGAERVALLLSRKLVSRGHSVSLISLEEPPNGALVPEFVAAGVRVIPMPKRPGAYDKTLTPRLMRFFLKERFDVVHTHNPLPLIYAALPGRISGAVAVHTKHGPHPDIARRLWLRRIGAASTHHFVAVSEATGEFSQELKEVSRRKLRVITNGTDLDIFKANASLRLTIRRELGIPEDAYVFGTVSRLAEVKNQKLMLDAALPLLGDRVRLVIVGDGPMRAPLEAQARALKIDKYVHFVGEVSNVSDYLASFDLFALTSDSEGLPLSLTEAMGASLPMIATAVGGVPKVVDEGMTGFLVPAGNVDGVRTAMAKLLGDPELSRTMGSAGRGVATRRYSVDRMVDDYLALYRAR